MQDSSCRSRGFSWGTKSVCLECLRVNFATLIFYTFNVPCDRTRRAVRPSAWLCPQRAFACMQCQFAVVRQCSIILASLCPVQSGSYLLLCCTLLLHLLSQALLGVHPRKETKSLTIAMNRSVLSFQTCSKGRAAWLETEVNSCSANRGFSIIWTENSRSVLPAFRKLRHEQSFVALKQTAENVKRVQITVCMLHCLAYEASRKRKRARVSVPFVCERDSLWVSTKSARNLVLSCPCR